MKIYLAICIDRHVDPHVKAFAVLERAKKYARGWVDENARHPESIEESDVGGWLYHCQYSEEGDYVFVIDGELE